MVLVLTVSKTFSAVMIYMDVSENNGTSKSSILIGFSIVNHPFWGFSPYFWKQPYISVLYTKQPLQILQRSRVL